MLNKSSIIWAIEYLHKHSDSDLFPKILELDAIIEKKDAFANKIIQNDLSAIDTGAYRRFIVPKDDISYRQATQLDLQDNIILSAIIYQYGSLIESRRQKSDIVFSYRFHPEIEYGLYADRSAWNSFWQIAANKSIGNKTILWCDIADFYNQISHHVIENQLINSTFPNQIMRWIMKLLRSTTAGVSRGIPVGPHPMHIIAEASMIPIDNSLLHQGIRFIRYVDDIIVFCDNENDARLKLSKIATTLDKQQRLMLQRHKTKIINAHDFISICSEMIEDRPISKNEDLVLNIIKKYSNGNPYKTVSYEEISNDDWEKLSKDIIRGIICDYLKKEPIDFDRLRWFYRRLAQVGHPDGVDITLDNIEKLIPCFANVCLYLASGKNLPPDKWITIGEKILALLRNDIIRSNEYYRLLLLSLFTRNRHINHFSSLTCNYPTSDPFARREIILSAKQNNATDWLREQKENYVSMDEWQKMAYIFSISAFPKDERKYFINQFAGSNPVMSVLSAWAKEQS